VERQITSGSHALVPCGTTGESTTLSHEEHHRVIELCVEAAKGRAPVIAGAGSNSTEEAISLLAHAKKVGAHAALVVSPYYNRPTQEGVYAHYKTLNETVQLPVFVYNVPARTGSDVTPESMGRLAKLPNIIGVKDATAQLDRVARHMPRARIDGFTVQPMAARPGAHELICGLIEDSVFGPVVLFGQGGTSVEVVRDKAVALLPLNMTLAQDLVRRTRVAKLLAGYRDRPAADIDAVARTLMALGQMAVDIPELAELDINPLWADASGVLALDARVKLSAGAKPGTERFAIRPYPSELEARVEDQRGRSYFLRPVRPEDAPLLQAMILRCDPEDIRMRFFSALKRLPDKLAARLTQIDYDREMAFVAMTSASDEDPAVGGVVRLSADPDGQRAEYSVIVRSDLKGTGLGWQLMQVMLRYAKARGIGTVFGEVLRENRAMLDMAAELGFTRHERADDPGIVEATIHP